ncbi:MAG: hypothetical protein ACTSQ8_18860 [Candidatus Helarchaeota archaeon]
MNRHEIIIKRFIDRNHYIDESKIFPNTIRIDGGIMAITKKDMFDLKNNGDFSPPQDEEGIYEVEGTYYNMRYIHEIMECIGDMLIRTYQSQVTDQNDGETINVMVFDTGDTLVLLGPRDPPDEEEEEVKIISSKNVNTGMAFLL